MAGFDKGEFEIGQQINLELIKETDGYENDIPKRVLKDDRNRVHVVARLPFQTGIKYTPKNPGDLIEYKVLHINSDYSPILKQSNPDNKYFINKSELSSEAQEIYNEVKAFSGKDKSLTLEKQYENHNGNWIWSFLTQLNHTKKRALKNTDILGLKNILQVTDEVSNIILKSGFLLSYTEDKRKKSSDIIEDKIKKNKSLELFIEKVLESEDREKEIAKIFSQPISSQDENKLNSNLSQLLRYFDHLISNSLIDQLLEKSVQNFDIDLREFLNRALWSRKKRIRFELFEEEISNPTKKISLKDNLDLKHLILLTKLDLSIHINKAKILILEATILRYEAYFTDSIEKINECIELLKTPIQLHYLIPDKYEQDIWFRDRNFCVAQCQRFLAKHATNLEDTISHYKSSSHYYGKFGSKSSYVDSGLVAYFEVALLIENDESLQSIAKHCKKQYTFYNMPDKRNLVADVWFLAQLKDMFEIMSMIGHSTTNNKKLLLDYQTNKYSKNTEKNDQLYNSKISSVVLSSMLLDDKNQEFLAEQLSMIFKEGIIELKQYSPAEGVDVDSAEYKENQLINTISRVETQTLEHKGSWSLDIDKYIEKEPHNALQYNQETQVVKGVAAMLNADRGGKLYIGVLELKPKYRKEGAKNALIERLGAIELDGNNNVLIGVDNELKHKWGNDSDNLCQQINRDLKKYIDEAAAKHFELESRIVKGKTIIEITIFENSFNEDGWWINEYTDLPVRESNQVKVYPPGQALKWLREMKEFTKKSRAGND